LQNKEKKAGEVEKIRPYRRKLAKFLSKIRDTLQNEKEEIYPCKVPKRSREKRTPSFASRIVLSHDELMLSYLNYFDNVKLVSILKKGISAALR
jgi:hypothetical protein